MGDAAQGPEQIISLPRGGGAVQGIGEKFTTDPQTGTGNHSIPIVVPAGRRGLAPNLELAYSTGNGNGHFGLGWTLSIPGISRKTSRGVPVYDDDGDVFVLSGSEDLLVVGPAADGGVQYRPRSEGLFATVVHYRGPGQDHWVITGKDGLVSRYGGLRPVDAPEGWLDPATLSDPEAPDHVFAWKLTETTDTLGNRIVYEYGTDEGEKAGHRWRQPMLRTIRYAEHSDGQFLVTVEFGDEARPDEFSSYRAGFEVRASRRYAKITTHVHPGSDEPVRRYELRYRQDAHNGMSLLSEVHVVGFDDAGVERRDMPPVTLGYSAFEPGRRRLLTVGGADPPAVALSDPGYELVDVTGEGLPDVLQCNGVMRYWRNLGDGTFDRPRSIRDAPTGVHLGDPGVRLLDADGDGRADLIVSDATGSGYFPLRFGPRWGMFQRYPLAPSVGLNDPQVRLVDLTGDGVTDAVQGSTHLLCYTNDPTRGWTGPRPARLPAVDPPPQDLTDPRVRWADMSGDGLTDIVLLRTGSVHFWPNLGHGRWGNRIRMTNSPQLPRGHDPARLLLGDIDGDGLADLVLVDGGEATVWINRSGDAWSDPITVRGAPAAGWDVRLTDLLGTGTAGILWSRPAPGPGRSSMLFLDLTGGVRPRLLSEVDNHIGAVTRIGYASSTAFSMRDGKNPATRWRTPLPFPVAVVAKVETIDGVSRSRLTTEYRYRHGYWDGEEHEFRGFGCVEQFDAELNDNQPDALARVRPVEAEHLSPPTLTRTWFHLGPVDVDATGEWVELDFDAEYWAGDRPLLDHTARVVAFLDGLPDPRSRRDGLRALRGRVLRSEMFATDNLTKPYTVTEHAYELREEAASGDHRVFFAHEIAQRTTQWERGDDPMTQYRFTGCYDDVGQPHHTTLVAPPRRASCRQPITGAVVGAVSPDPVVVLATHMRTDYANSAESHIRDRVSDVRTFELREPPPVPETDQGNVGQVLRDQRKVVDTVVTTFENLDAGQVELIGHIVHHYDGPAYTGLPVGGLGAHGLLTRSETLVYTDALLDYAYETQRPGYLGGPQPLPAGAPTDFGVDLGFRREPGGDGHAAGWYADTVRNAYDVQLSTAAEPLPMRGLVLGVQDPLRRETRVLPDAFWMFPLSVHDAAGLEATATYDYRAGRPRHVVDQNGHTTQFRFHALGLLRAMFVQGRDGEGDTEDAPGVTYSYDFSATPVSVHTTRRVWYASAGVSDEVIESREYSDGLGRLIQTRTQADDLAFGADGADTGLLVPDPVSGTPQAVPGGVGGPAVGLRDPARVVVSGWQTLDNKGRVVAEYEPFFSSGWDYQTTEQGRPIRKFYDPRGEITRVVNPDGSQRHTVFGVPSDLTDPETLQPSPWTTTSYDENDLAPDSTSPSGEPLTARVPPDHHHTPTTLFSDALGRPVCGVARGGSDPSTWHMTRTEYDSRGNILTVRDELGRAAFSYAYDLMNRRLRVDSIDAGRTFAVLDATGAPVHEQDARGVSTLHTYDLLGRPAGVYAHDRAGDPLTVRERLTYGDGGDPAQPAAERLAARVANRLGRLWQHRDEAGLVTSEGYDFVGQVTARSRRVVRDAVIAAADASSGWVADWSALDAESVLEAESSVISTRYDALGRVVELSAPADTAGHRALVEPRYARSGALRSVHVDGVPYVRLIVHDARSRRVLAVLGNGLMTRYAYHPDTFRLVRLRTETATDGADVWTGTGPPLQDLTYTYDLIGNVTSIDERTAGCGVAGTADGRDRLTRRFEYDAFYRLVAATGRACASISRPRPTDDTARCGAYTAPFTAAPDQSNAPDVTEAYREVYTYDLAGNLLDLHYRPTTGPATGAWHRTFGLADLAPQDWADAATNRLTSVHAGTSVTSLTYDASGNLVTEGASREFSWDHAGRLIGFRVHAGGGTSVSARYLYGADGARVKKWVRRSDSAALDESTMYLDDLLERHRWTKAGGGENTQLHVMDGAERVTSIRSGPPHPDDAGPAVRYDLGDHLGSATLALDQTGEWTNREEYFPYGETSFGSFARKRYRFAAKELDEETGMAYYGARFYAPAFGRWTSCDSAGTVDGYNPYRAFGNNPIVKIDRGGMSSDVSGVPIHGTDTPGQDGPLVKDPVAGYTSGGSQFRTTGPASTTRPAGLTPSSAPLAPSDPTRAQRPTTGSADPPPSQSPVLPAAPMQHDQPAESWDPDIFLWFSFEAKRDVPIKIGGSKGHLEGAAEVVEIFGGNSAGPYHAEIKALGGAVELDLAIKKDSRVAYGALYGGEEQIEQYKFKPGGGDWVASKEPIILAEGGYGLGVGGAYQAGHVARSTDTGIYLGVRLGPYGAGFGFNLDLVKVFLGPLLGPEGNPWYAPPGGPALR